MKYTIKEFSEYLGITTDTLRLYEKYGIVKPMKDVKNNYRYFDDLDARNLLACRWYRSLDIPLKEAARLTINANKTEICQALADKKREVDLEIERLTELSKVINETCSLIGSTQNELVYIVKQTPATVRLVQTHLNTLISDGNVRGKETQIWMDALPSVSYTFKGDLTEDGTALDYTWGMAMTETEFKSHAMDPTKALEYIPAMQCLTTVVTSPYEEFLHKEVFEAIIKKASDLGYMHRGFIWGRLIITASSEGKRISFIELMLPITF